MKEAIFICDNCGAEVNGTVYLEDIGGALIEVEWIYTCSCGLHRHYAYGYPVYDDSEYENTIERFPKMKGKTE